MVGGGKKAYNTCCSQAVTHPGTGQAQYCLTSVIGRELVYSVWYGHRQQWLTKSLIINCTKAHEKVILYTHKNNRTAEQSAIRYSWPAFLNP